MKRTKLFRKLTAASLAMVCAAASLPMYAGATDCLGQNNFDDGVGFPWRVKVRYPGEQAYSLRDGSCKITIINPGGSGVDENGNYISGAQQRGGGTKSDCQFVHRNLHIEEGHTYKIHWEVDASEAGELHTHISAYGDDENGVWQNNQSNWSQGWDNVRISNGKNSFDSEFTASKTLEVAEWAFYYGGAGPYQKYDCFPEGTTLKFDNLTLECVDCGDTFRDKKTTPCLWDPSNEMGVITPRSDVRVNQIGYHCHSEKRATYATSEEKSALSFSVFRNGEKVYTGKGILIGKDEDSGEYCQILDFSEVWEHGIYTIVVDDEDNVYTNLKTGEIYKKYISHQFIIGYDLYTSMLKDVMNYYYQRRSGTDILPQYITSYNENDPGGKNKLSHSGFNTKDEAYIQSQWTRNYNLEFKDDDSACIDVTGGWYTSSDYSKNVVSGANAVWLMQNLYERSKNNGTDKSWDDDKLMSIPQSRSVYGSVTNGTGTPDILDEARYELEWMFSMIVNPEKDPVWGRDYAGFVYHEVIDHRYVDPFASRITNIYEINTERIVNPPSYAATFDMIACAAQAARLWKGIDDEFAEKCLLNAENSWDAIMKYRKRWDLISRRGVDDQFAPELYYTNVNPISDYDVRDEAYWAACELFSTTGSSEYYDILSEYDGRLTEDGHNKAFDIGMREGYYGKYTDYSSELESDSFTAFSNTQTASFGTLSLLLSEKTSGTDKKLITENLLRAADCFVERENETDNAMQIPYKKHIPYERIGYPSNPWEGYEYASNACILNNAIIMAYAYDVTYDRNYYNGVEGALNYLFGRNGLGISYVTGYGSYYVNNPADKYWIYEIDPEYPMAPDGVFVSGPCSNGAEEYIYSLGMDSWKIPYQKCYVDSVEAQCVNQTAPEWQAALAWALFFEDELRPCPDDLIMTSSTSATATVATTTTTSSMAVLPEPKKYGDANCDEDVDMADAVLIMQSIANPDKFAIGGRDENALTAQGAANADVDRSSPGLTGKDALMVQKYLLGAVNTLVPE